MLTLLTTMVIITLKLAIVFVPNMYVRMIIYIASKILTIVLIKMVKTVKQNETS